MRALKGWRWLDDGIDSQAPSSWALYVPGGMSNSQGYGSELVMVAPRNVGLKREMYDSQ
jgi:hypothetical protein